MQAVMTMMEFHQKHVVAYCPSLVDALILRYTVPQ